MKLIIFTAPSGAGKTTIVNHLLKTHDKLAFSVSATTRTKRDYEVDGKHYYFLNAATFKQKIDAEDFLEWEEVYPDIFYGTLYTELERLTAAEKAILFDIDVKGALNIKKQFGNQVQTIFIKPPSLDILVERLKNRETENQSTLNKRIERMKYELSFEDKFDKVLVNDSLDGTLLEATKLVNDFLGQ